MEKLDISFWLNTVKRAAARTKPFGSTEKSRNRFWSSDAALLELSYGSLVSRIPCKRIKSIPNWNGLVLSLFIVPNLGTPFYVWYEKQQRQQQQKKSRMEIRKKRIAPAGASLNRLHFSCPPFQLIFFFRFVSLFVLTSSAFHCFKREL